MNRERAEEFYREHQGFFSMIHFDSLNEFLFRKILLQASGSLHDLASLRANFKN